MLRSIHIASRHRIMMDVINLLTHDHLVHDGLWVTAFLPNLVGGFGFVGALEKGQQIQHAAGACFFQVIDDAPCRPRFKALHGRREIRGGGDEVRVVFQDNVTEQREIPLSL